MKKNTGFASKPINATKTGLKKQYMYNYHWMHYLLLINMNSRFFVNEAGVKHGIILPR